LQTRSKAVGPLANRRLCLVPHTCRAEPCQVRTRQRWVSDQHRGWDPKVRLRTTIRSRWHLSQLFSRLSVSPVLLSLQKRTPSAVRLGSKSVASIGGSRRGTGEGCSPSGRKDRAAAVKLNDAQVCAFCPLV